MKSTLPMFKSIPPFSERMVVKGFAAISQFDTFTKPLISKLTYDSTFTAGSSGPVWQL